MSAPAVLYPEVLAEVVANCRGKGEARHGHGAAFVAQPWWRYGQVHGLGFLTGQAEKKWDEANTAFARDDAWYVAEAAGACAYACFALILLAADERRGEVSQVLMHEPESASAERLIAMVWPRGPSVLPLSWHAGVRSRTPAAALQLRANVAHMAQAVRLRMPREVAA